MSPEEMAEMIVRLDPSGHHVTLTALGLPPVALARHLNAAVSADECERVRAVVAAVIRSVSAEGRK